MATKSKKEEKFNEEIGETVAEITPVAEIIPESKPEEITPIAEIIPESKPEEIPAKKSEQTVRVASVRETELVVVNNLQQGFRIKKEKAHKNVKVGDYIII